MTFWPRYYDSKKTPRYQVKRICAQNFEAVLAMIVKLAGEAILDVFLLGYVKTNSKTPVR